MTEISVLMLAILMAVAAAAGAEEEFETDTIATSAGELQITFIGHASLIVEFGGKTIHIDPCSREADYSGLPKADMVVLTHEHHDHFDMKALKTVSTAETLFVSPESCSADLKAEFGPGENVTVIKNGDVRTVDGLNIEAVPAYNIVHMRGTGQPFHPKGRGNGYVITFGDTRVYIAGDTENTPEMKSLKNIDVAFLPMNLPYTMTPEMVADAARTFRPKILYPYHFGSTDTSKLVELLKDVPKIEVRIRKMP